MLLSLVTSDQFPVAKTCRRSTPLSSTFTTSPARGVPFSGTPPFFLSRFSSRWVGHDELEFRPALVIVIHEDFEAAAQVFAGMLLELPAQFGGQAFGAVAAHDREGVGVLGDVVGQDVAGFEPGRRLLPADHAGEREQIRQVSVLTI